MVFVSCVLFAAHSAERDGLGQRVRVDALYHVTALSVCLCESILFSVTGLFDDGRLVGQGFRPAHQQLRGARHSGLLGLAWLLAVMCGCRCVHITLARCFRLLWRATMRARPSISGQCFACVSCFVHFHAVFHSLKPTTQHIEPRRRWRSCSSLPCREHWAWTSRPSMQTVSASVLLCWWLRVCG